MKAILSKLNAAGIKDLFLNRWELVIVGIAGLFALTAVAGMTDWQGFDSTPTKLETEARGAQAQLGTTAWPDTEKEQFKFVSLSQQTSDAVFRPLPLAVLEYSTAMSQKMYPKLKPRDEAQFVPVEDLIAEAGTFVLETVPEQPEMPEGGEAPAVAGGALAVPGSPAVPAAGPGRVPGAGAPAMAAHAAAGPVDPAAMMMAGGGMMGADGMMGTITGGAGRTGRGVRYVAVRGVLPYRVQLEKLSRALNLDTKAEARDALNYVDFEIERQRAIPGPNPWPEGEGAWEAVDTQVAVDLLTNEAANWDAELVAPESTDAVFTMPLPTRIEGPWTPEEASHPRLERLTAEEIEAEAKRTAEALAKAKAEAEAESGPKKGFGRIQRDINRAMAAPGMDMMMPADGMMAPGMGHGMPGVGRPGAMRGGAPMHGMSPAGAPPGMGRPGGMVPGSPAMAGHGAMAPGMGMGMGMQGMGGYADIKPRELVLFRYFDTVVEPGAAYRYRVRLKALNPNFQYALDQVAAAAVAEGEFRFTDWSEPTAPVVVPKDTVYTTNKVPRRQGRPENKAELAITHWFSEKGTLVSHTVTNVYGQLVGGKVKTKLLDIGAPSLEETEVTIRGSEVLLDSLGLAGLASSVNTAAPSEQLKKSLGELGIDKNSWNKMLDTGELEFSVVVNRAGEIVINDTLISRPEKQEFDKEYKEEQDKYKDLLEAKPTTPANGLDAYMADGMMAADPAAMAGHGEGKGKKKKGRAANPARMGGSMMPPGMMAPGMMAPGMAPGMVPGSPAGPAGKKSKK